MTVQHAASAVSFDLLTEPWIPVAGLDGAQDLLSLRGVFTHASEVRQVLGDVPTQSFAIERLLIAIALRASQHRFDYDDRVSAAETWLGLLEHPEPLQDDALDYLDRWQDRFDLLHPHRPFFQVASLQASSGTFSELARIIADVPNNEKYFTTRGGEALQRIPLAEAARWIVHTQAMDPSGIKTGAVGDDRVKGGRGYPIGPGWAAGIGGVTVAGETLASTLLLNLAPVGRANADSPDPRDAPAWEREVPLTSAVRDDGAAPAPRGPLDLLTWQSRRIRLKVEGSAATGVILSNGDPLVGAEGLSYERMTALQRTAATRKSETAAFTPTKHRPERMFWRGLTGLVPRLAAASDVGRIAPASLEWIDEVAMVVGLPESLNLRLRASGLKLDSKSSVIEEMISDEVVTPAALFGPRGAHLAFAAEAVIAVTEQAILLLGDYARSLAAVHSADGQSQRTRAVENAYHAVDPEFRQWLAGLSSDTDVDDARALWTRRLFSRLSRTADDLLASRAHDAWLLRESALRRAGGRKFNAFQCRDQLGSELTRLLLPAGLTESLPSATSTPGEGSPDEKIGMNR